MFGGSELPSSSGGGRERSVVDRQSGDAIPALGLSQRAISENAVISNIEGLRGGASASRHDPVTSRQVVAVNSINRLRSGYTATTGQVFGEIGRSLTTCCSSETGMIRT